MVNQDCATTCPHKNCPMSKSEKSAPCNVISRRQKKVYWAMIFVLGILAAINIYMPYGSFAPVDPELPLPKPLFALANFFIMFIIYGGLGYIALKLCPSLELPGMWKDGENWRTILVKPIYYAIVLGVLFIFIDIMLANYNSMGRFPHPPFPTSLIASGAAGIGEELIFRLFQITVFLWALNKLFKIGKSNLAFWFVALVSAFAFTIGHIPVVMYITGVKEIGNLNPILLIELFVLNGSLSLAAADLYRKHGYVSAVVLHFVLDLVWHVFYGLLS